MTAQSITQFAVHVGLLVLGVSFLLTVWRVIKGPTLPDRVIALDMLVGIVMGFIALIAIRTGFTLYIDIAISLGLVGFLATVAFARFILSRKRREGEDGSPPEGSAERAEDEGDKSGHALAVGRAARAPAAVAAAPAPPALPSPAALPATVAAPQKELVSKPPISKSEATKASAAKVKIAKAKAARKSAAAADPAQTRTPATPATTAAKPRAPRKPAVKKETP